MKIVLEIDDDELRRLLVPLLSPRDPASSSVTRPAADRQGRRRPTWHKPGQSL
jgi:hypothetical protein